LGSLYDYSIYYCESAGLITLPVLVFFSFHLLLC
jgi:hypothetical protein